jgi:hypothetical protein
MFAAIVFAAVAVDTTSGVWNRQNAVPVAAVEQASTATTEVAVGPQYDTTHVYVAPDQFDGFVSSVLATSVARQPNKACSR